jgi:hypothetical protein
MGEEAHRSPNSRDLPIREEDNPNLSYLVRDGDLCVAMDVTKVVDAKMARVGDQTPDLSHHKHTP